MQLNALAQELGVKGIYVKDESYRFGLNAFKVLGGSYDNYYNIVSSVDEFYGGMRTYIARTTGNQNCFSTIHRSLPPLLRILFYVRRH